MALGFEAFMEPEERAEGEPGARGVVPGRCVRVSEETAPVNVPGNGADGEPTIELIRDGDVIRAIDVVCTCGRKIRLRCIYDRGDVK